MPKEQPTVKIRVEWHGWNYGRSQGDPYWTHDDTAIVDGRVCPRSYIIHYGSGNVRKTLKRFYRHREDTRKQWIEYYGSHDRLSYTKLVFTLVE